MLVCLSDRKPVVVRQRTQALHELCGLHPEWDDCILEVLEQIPFDAYRDSMQPVIRKDAQVLRSCITSAQQHRL